MIDAMGNISEIRGQIMSKERAQKGFTLIEMMIVLVIAVIFIVAAVSSFSELIKNKRMTTQANDFTLALMLARSEAMKRTAPVTVCKSSNGTSCITSDGWEQGWIVFVDPNYDATVATTTDIIRVHSSLDGDNTLRGAGNVASYVMYTPTGVSRLTGGGAQAGTLVLCDDRGTGDHTRSIIISATGRARVFVGSGSCPTS